MTRLTPHFTLEELTASRTATLRKIDNTPTTQAVHNLCALAVLILEPLREACGHPLIITSGYRCPQLNSAVGGVKNSYHLLGLAADIRCTQVQGVQLCTLLRNNPWLDKALFEHNRNSQWLHVQINAAPRHYINTQYYVL